MRKTYKQEIIDLVEEYGDFAVASHGFFIYWPGRSRGSFNAQDLRILADELDRRNDNILELRRQNILDT